MHTPATTQKVVGPLIVDNVTYPGAEECPERSLSLRMPLVMVLLAGAFATSPVLACTLWAASGAQVDGGGTLIAKNRDWKPDHHQIVRVVHPGSGYAYIGLFAEGNRTPGLKAGTNQRGLTILSASSNIPKQLRQTQPDKHSVMRQILARYASVEELDRDAGHVFSSSRAGFFLISDASQVMTVEVGLQGRFATHRIAAGTMAHTNHYLDPALAGQFEDKPGISSTTRLARIRALLAMAATPYNMQIFATMSRDRHDGPDNSLWRHGREYTLASWIVLAPQAGPPHLHLVVANPDEPENTLDLVLDDQFWSAGNTRNLPPALSGKQ